MSYDHIDFFHILFVLLEYGYLQSVVEYPLQFLQH
jgi:hypothetical protein